MAKDLLSEKELLEVINKELAINWARHDCYCRVDHLREASLPDRNWVIYTFSTGGITLNYSKECDELRQNVLRDLVVKYDVRWLYVQ